MKFRNWKITKLFVVPKSISVGSTPSPNVVTQCSKLCQPLTSLSLTSSDSEKYKQICMNADKSRKIQKNIEYPQNHQKQHIIRKAKNI
jgi:hypothetical protein